MCSWAIKGTDVHLRFVSVVVGHSGHALDAPLQCHLTDLRTDLQDLL